MSRTCYAILWQFMFRVMSQERVVEFNFPSPLPPPPPTFFEAFIIIILTVQRRGTSSLVPEPVSLSHLQQDSAVFTCSKIQPCIIITAAEILVCDQLAGFFVGSFRLELAGLRLLTSLLKTQHKLCHSIAKIMINYIHMKAFRK